jgi:small-conductance mechanosensitive channel
MVDTATIILVFEAAAIAAGSWLISRFLTRIITRAAKRAGAAPGLLRAIRAVLSLAWIVVVAVWLLSITGIASLFSVLTLSGIVGLAVSLALQNTLSNMISGILLFSDGLLRLDDTVEYGGIKGRIVKIGLRNTWIQRDDGTVAVISNSNLQGGPLIIHSAGERVQKKIGL